MSRTALFAMAFVTILSFAAQQRALAQQVTVPFVPANLQVALGNRAYLAGHAVGTQAYICLPSGPGVAWTFFGPQATLFNDELGQVITHFLSPNPDENGTLRATWQHSRDTSAIWALAIASSRHRFSVRKSAALIGAFSSTASSVIAWQTSP